MNTFNFGEFVYFVHRSVSEFRPTIKQAVVIRVKEGKVTIAFVDGTEDVLVSRPTEEIFKDPRTAHESLEAKLKKNYERELTELRDSFRRDWS